MKLAKIFLILIAIYSISIAVEMIFKPDMFKSALTTCLLSIPLYGALISYYFYWRSTQPPESAEEIA